MRRSIFHHPHISIGTALQHPFEFHRHTAGMRIVCPHIASAGIGNDTRHIALTAGHIPDAVFRPIDHHQRLFAFRVSRLRRSLQGEVGVFFRGEKAVRRRTAPNQTAVKAHPFGATEGRTFHVVGTAYRGDP